LADHDRDSDDIPDDPYYDPVDLHKKGDRRHDEPFFDKQQFLAEKVDEKKLADAEEVQVLINEQEKEDKQMMGELTRQFNEKQEREREEAKTDQERKEGMEAEQ